MRVVVLEVADWVDIVALTPEKKIVVVRQYRFGTGKTTTEIPAGVVDAGETPKQAAIRELREETGYTSRHWKYFGWVEPNPAFQNNLCHQWLATDVVKTHLPNFDEGEDISVSEMSLEELSREVKEGRMRNSLALLALSRAFDLWNLAS
jgi:ADP-ribose pyrophosphatase